MNPSRQKERGKGYKQNQFNLTPDMGIHHKTGLTFLLLAAQEVTISGHYRCNLLSSPSLFVKFPVLWILINFVILVVETHLLLPFSLFSLTEGKVINYVLIQFIDCFHILKNLQIQSIYMYHKSPICKPIHPTEGKLFREQ